MIGILGDTSSTSIYGSLCEYAAYTGVKQPRMQPFHMLLNISKGPTYLGFNFPLFPNWVSPFQGDTCQQY